MPTNTPTEEFILQGVREWLKLCGSSAGLSDAQVIPSKDSGPRPPLPYITVNVTSSDMMIGEDEPVVFLADVVTVTGGTTSDVYVVTVDGIDATHTRGAGESDSDVAAALAAASAATGDFIVAESAGSLFWVASLRGTAVAVAGSANLSVETAEQPLVGVMCQRSATISVQAHGAGAGAWLERAVQKLALPAASDLLDAAGLTVIALGGRQDVGVLIDTSIEPRVLREFEVGYALRAEPETVIALEVAETSVELSEYDGDPDPYTIAVETQVS